MNSTQSFAYSVIEKVRLYADEPSGSTVKYTDDILMRQIIPTSYSEVFGMLRQTSDAIPVVAFTLNILKGQDRYVIPGWTDGVLRLVRRNEGDRLVYNDWVPKHDMHLYGPGWKIEANEIYFNPLPTADEEWELWLVPSGDMCMHYGTGVVQDESTIRLAATPTLGLLDRRINAYAGMVLRHLTAGRVIEERLIESYDPVTRDAVVRVPFTQDSNHLPADAANCTYEIAPLGNRSLWDAIAWKSLMTIGATRDISMKKMQFWEVQYQNALKATMDRARVQRRVAPHFQRNTVDAGELVAYDVWSFSQ